MQHQIGWNSVNRPLTHCYMARTGPSSLLVIVGYYFELCEFLKWKKISTDIQQGSPNEI